MHSLKTRVFSFLLAFVMVLTQLPVQAFATQSDDQQIENIEQTIETEATADETATAEQSEGTAPEVTEAVRQIQNRIDEILVTYLGTTSATLEEIQNIVAQMDEVTRMDLQFETLLLEEDLSYMDLSESEQVALVEANAVYSNVCDVLMDYPFDGAFYTTISMLDGGLSLADTQNTIKNSNGTVTATAKGSLISKKTNTITITNNLATAATLSFDYSVSNANSYNVAGITNPANGTVTKLLDPGASVTVSVTSNSGWSNLTVTLTLSNISLVEAKASSKVTFQYDNTMGSITVAGAAVESGAQQDVSLEGVELTAAAGSGVTFLGWIDGVNHTILSKDATFTLKPADDMTVRAVFAKDTAWFLVNGNALYEDLNAAATAAAAADNKTVVLFNNGTLPAGDYTIPAGVTLLIPFDAANTVYTSEPGKLETYTKPTAYRTLTMAAGAKLEVNGSLSVAGCQSAKYQNNGWVTGPVGFIKMNENSAIVVNKGGNLYAWGYITGSGTVEAKSEATVYEDFQLADFRGGDGTTSMASNNYGVFPMSQYYLQNIEVPLTLHAGAKEYAFMSAKISVVGIQGTNVPVVGNQNAMFKINSGYIVKDYLEGTGRTKFTTAGNVEVSTLKMSMKLGIFGETTIDSAKFNLPIPGHFTVEAVSGSVALNQDLALLPGSELYIGEGVSGTIGNGTRIVVYDLDDWGGYCGAGNAKSIQLGYAPGGLGTEGREKDALVQIDGTIDASAGAVYTTAGGANVYTTGTGKVITKPGTETKTYQATQKAVNGNQEVSYVEIPVTPAKLQNADESYLDTAALPYAEYTYSNGVWTGKCLHVLQEAVTTAATCTVDGVKTISCACGYSYTEAIPSTGHNEVVDAAVAPTCTETGLTEGKHCSVCNEVLVAQNVVPSLGHTPGAAATCTTAQVCTVCGATIKDALGHTEVIDAAKAATCTETGLTEGKHCDVCGEVLVAQEVVDALGHTEVTDAAKAPTCTATGLTEGKHCDVCGEVLVKQEVVDALGHTEVIDAAVAPTCTETGLTEGKHCDVCGGILVAQIVVDALGHIEEIDAAVAPTCSETGLTEGKHCSVCNEVLVAQETVETLPHTPVFVEKKEAICGEAGHEEGEKCSVCGEILSGMEEIEAEEHQITAVEAKNPTYTSVGWNAYERCLRCGYTTYVELPQLEEAEIATYEELLINLALLEEMAAEYVKTNPGKDPVALVIKYIRTGVERYNSGSWGIMAGYEDADFAKYVFALEDSINSQFTSTDDMIKVSGLKNLKNITLPNGDVTDIGHMFGTMDITWHNKNSRNHADVAGWAGDLVDLLEFSDTMGVSGSLEEMAAKIRSDLLLETPPLGTSIPGFNEMDMLGDMDALYLMQKLGAEGYNFVSGSEEPTGLTGMLNAYFTEDLSMVQRADYFLKNRLDGVSTRNNIRDAVYKAYTGNKVIATLESTREFSSGNLDELRKAVCYAFADYICELAGDYVDVTENPYYTIFSGETTLLAPGITQDIYKATSADGKQMIFYVATADLTRDDVDVFANYNNNDPAAGWGMQRVLDQANAAQEKYGDPESEYYIPNYNVIASTNGAGFNMSTGEPSGLLVMGGVEYHAVNGQGFFGILKDGTPVIGTTEEYNTIYKGQVAEAIAGFGTTLIKDGEIVVSSTAGADRAPRTAVGITKTGKVVLMVFDGRQEPFSVGGNYAEIAQVMLEAGCYQAINLDGGGSTTYVAKQPGDEELSVVNSPSDGAARSVSTSLMIVSTAPSSTAFDHAILESDADYLTIGTNVQITPKGISATGNEAELPEGTTWAVSDERWGSITEDGVFTGLRNGSVEVYLMSGETVIGSKTMHIVVPDNVYFTKSNIDTVYGATVELPVKALYEGKQVAVNENDLVFTLSNTKAGSVEGLKFVCSSDENSGIKNVNVTAALAADSSIKASAAISLYKQGEMSFDFDQATGGDRMLAWYREVTNAQQEDANTYIVVNPDEKMVTNYTLAIDMTQIPIPEKLEDLTYMLPGADMEGASAWTFLLQLAQRISPLTEIKAQVAFDPDFDVDISNLKLVNDYFVLTNVELDALTNTATLTLNWKKQTAAVNPDTANPLCIVSGIKLTPKANADWGSKNRLDVVHAGSIGYKIYMRASALYSFSQKEENQKVFGLYAYANPNDAEDRGGFFQDTYKSFEDTYTLINAVKEGWVNEDGGYAYYVDGRRLTGVQMVDGLYYGFGDEGINVGKNPYSGLFTMNGKTYYAILGELQKGWFSIDDVWYFFDWSSGAGRNGAYTTTMAGIKVTYEMQNGRLVKGFWYNDGKGKQYFEGPYHIKQGWEEIDGETYFFDNYYACTGIYPVYQSHDVIATWYEFTETGALVGMLEDGLYWHQGSLYYVKNGHSNHKGMYLINGDYYCFNNKGAAYVNTKVWVSNTNGLRKAGTYRFGADGKVIMTNELVNENGTLYYYEGGMRTANAGILEFNGSYYYVGSGAIAVTNQTIWVSKTNGLFTAGTFRFDAEGKMIMTTEVVNENGTLYYYNNGRRTPNAGLVEFEGAYYHIDGAAKPQTNVTVWVSKTNGLWPKGSYTFGADGKMIIYNGIHDGYYYVEGIKTAAGLINVDGNYYYAEGGGRLIASKNYWISKTNNLLSAGTYRFDAEGKIIMTTELVNENGTLYYYKDGKRTANAGILEIDGSYYYIGSGAIAVTSQSIWTNKTNGLFAAGTYRFDAEGKMIMDTAIVNENGTLYYYKNGKRTASAGLVEFEGAYYHIDGAAKAQTDVTIWVSKPNGLWPVGSYTFGADGKMIIYNGVHNGYYYVEGIKTAAGLIYENGNYYYAEGGGKLVVSRSYWISKTNNLLSAGTYRFDAEGKIIMTTELVDENGTMYYYKDGKRTANAGLLLIDGSYYYIASGAMPVVDQKYWVSKTNGLMPVGSYTFGADGKMIL